MWRESEQPKANVKSFDLGLASIWLVQTIVSFLAQAVIAAYFGAGADLDAYLVGTTLPTTIYMIVSTGLGATVIIYYNRAKSSAGKSEAREKIGGLMVVLATISLLAAILTFLAADILVRLIAPGLLNEVHEKAVACLRITAPSLPFIILFCLLTGLLQAEGHFYVTSISPILLTGLVPLPVIVRQDLSPETLAWGFNLSAGASCLFLLAVTVLNKLVQKGQLAWTEWKYMIALGAPAFVAASLTHGVWMLERYFASSLPPGGISALTYGQRIVNFVAGGLTFATSTTLLSHLSAWIENGETARAADLNRRVIRKTMVYAFAGVIGLSIGGEWLVRLAFERGQFDELAVGQTTTAVKLYLGMFVAYLFSVVWGRMALAVGEGKLMVMSTATLLLSYLVLAATLLRLLEFKGLALAASVAWLLSLSVYLYGMHRKYPYLYFQGTSKNINPKVLKA